MPQSRSKRCCYTARLLPGHVSSAEPLPTTWWRRSQRLGPDRVGLAHVIAPTVRRHRFVRSPEWSTDRCRLDSANMRRGREHRWEADPHHTHTPTLPSRPFSSTRRRLAAREVLPALRLLQGARSPWCRLRDVMTSGSNRAEWEQERRACAARPLCEIWSTMPPINKPLTASRCRRRCAQMVYTGDLRPRPPRTATCPRAGGIGVPSSWSRGGAATAPNLIDWVLAAYETDRNSYGA